MGGIFLEEITLHDGRRRAIVEYDLSKLFGYNFGLGPKVKGIYNLNVPIQQNSNVGTYITNF